MGRQIGIFGGVGSVAGLIAAVVVCAWRSSRPYAMGYVSGFAPLTQPWIPVVVLLAGCTVGEWSATTPARTNAVCGAPSSWVVRSRRVWPA